MKLVPIITSLLHNLESGQFLRRFFLDFEGTGLAIGFDPEFKLIYTDLEEQLPTYLAALAQVVAQAESELLLQLDVRRDRKITAVRGAWNNYRDTDVVAKKEAYNQLKPLINTYKNLATENYEAESLGIDNYIAGLKSTEHLPLVQLLNMIEQIDELEAANNLFKTTFNNRSNTTVSTVVYNTKLLKKNIFTTYKELAKYCLTMANRRTPSPYFVTALEAINNGRSYYANIIAHRNGNGGTTPPVNPAV